MSAPAPRGTADYSRGKSRSQATFPSFASLRFVLLVVGLNGALALVVSEFATLYAISVGTEVKDSITGHERHGFALAILGLAAIPMALGAAGRLSRPAMAALCAIGAVTLAIAIAGDVPDVNDTGLIGEQYERASAKPRAGLYLETAGGALLLVSGGGLLLMGTPPPPRRERDPERRPRPQYDYE